MTVEIKQIPLNKRRLKDFVKFPIDTLYRGHEYYVPALITDEVATFLPDKNPAFDFCECICLMAYSHNRPVGRVAGIINHKVNERKGVNEARFGFIDFINDNDVVDALIDAVKQWAKQKGMTQLTGPLGFSDMDPEGALIEGFDQLGTQATIYNFPYYSEQFERLGMVKANDWVEFKITVPKEVPPKMAKVANIVAQRYNLSNVRFSSRKQLVKEYGNAIFELINRAYDNLYGFSPLSTKQIAHYIKMYLPYLPLDDISLIVKNENRELVGVGISIPSLSKALIKCRGRIFPMGWRHLLNALRHADIVDLMLVAVDPEYQSKGVNSMLFNDLIPFYNKHGYIWAESNPEMEGNDQVQRQWQYFDVEQHKRRRAYTMPIE